MVMESEEIELNTSMVELGPHLGSPRLPAASALPRAYPYRFLNEPNLKSPSSLNPKIICNSLKLESCSFPIQDFVHGPWAPSTMT